MMPEEKAENPTGPERTPEEDPTMAEAKITTDHDVIRQWVECRGGRPATVARTKEGDEPGLLRIDLPDVRGEEDLEWIEWDTFFRQFEAAGFAFLYQERTEDGRPSGFCKLVSRADAAVF
jgi:hypothetical protein